MIIDWREVAQKVYDQVKSEITSKDLKMTLKVILVWDNQDSLRYIAQKKKWAEYCSIAFELIYLPEETSEEDLLNKVNELNNDSKTTWYLVQMPLPKHISEQKVIEAVDPKKDVDGFHQENYWKIAIWDDSGMKPCTPYWVMELLKAYSIDLSWKQAVVLGRSNIVWKPMALMLINSWATVTVCNSKTKNLNFFTKNADIIVSAVGRPEMLKKDMIWEETVVIDVGFTVLDGKIYWDADFKEITNAWNLITPVPGWVWPMTVAMIMKNLIKAHEIQKW